MWCVLLLCPFLTQLTSQFALQSGQRLAEFRSKMGSAGLAIVNSLLDSENGHDIPLEERLFNTDEKRSQYCRELLEDEQFAYADYESPKVSTIVMSMNLLLILWLPEEEWSLC